MYWRNLLNGKTNSCVDQVKANCMTGSCLVSNSGPTNKSSSTAIILYTCTEHCNPTLGRRFPSFEPFSLKDVTKIPLASTKKRDPKCIQLN